MLFLTEKEKKSLSISNKVINLKKKLRFYPITGP